MSAVGLGESAVCGRLQANTVATKKERVLLGADITAAGAVPTSGFYFIVPPANPTAYSLPVGVEAGDVLTIIHKSGSNVANITASPTTIIHGSVTTIAMTGGAHLKLVWGGTEWYVIGRDGTSAATATAVAGCPALA